MNIIKFLSSLVICKKRPLVGCQKQYVTEIDIGRAVRELKVMNYMCVCICVYSLT